MNIVLSCCANKGKGSYVLEKEGKVISQEVFNIHKDKGTTLKEYIFESVIRGLRVARNEVQHEDLLLIGVQNAHIADWLNGSKEYKGYAKYLDDISAIIETLDCRYLFSLTGVKKAKILLKENPKQLELEGVSSVFENM